MGGKVIIEIETTGEQVEAMAQVLKRIGFSDIRRLSETDAEAYNAQYALEQVRQSLSKQGHAPR